MKTTSRLLVIAALCAASTQVIHPVWPFGSSTKQKVRAYKTVARNKPWTVRITAPGKEEGQLEKEISKSTFKKNTDGALTKALYFDFQEGKEPVNLIFAYKNASGSGNSMSKEVVASDVPEGSQIEVQANEIRIVPDGSLERDDKAIVKPKIGSKKQKVRAYKKFDRDKKYTVKITAPVKYEGYEGQAEKEISKSTFLKNTDGPLTKGLYFDFGGAEGDEAYNTVYIYSSGSTSGPQVFKDTVKQSEFPKESDKQMEISKLGENVKIEAVDDASGEPDDKAAAQSKIGKAQLQAMTPSVKKTPAQKKISEQLLDPMLNTDELPEDERYDI